MKSRQSFKCVVWVGIFLLIGRNGLAQTTEKILQHSNQMYAAHQYDQALVGYQKLLQQGFENSDLHYNLANTYYRMNQIGPAILHYEKAIKLNPSNEDALFNLKIANLKVLSKIKPVEEFILVRWTRSMLHIFSFDTWATLQIVFGFLALMLMVFYMFVAQVKAKKISFYSGIFCLIIMGMSWMMAWGGKSDLQNSEYGIILSSSAMVKSEPTDNSKELTTLREGVKFKRLEIVGKWHQIKLSDGTLGWIQENNFQMI